MGQRVRGSDKRFAAYVEELASVIGHGNVVATQYHPEKSAAVGLRMYRNFVRWVAESAAISTRPAAEHV